MPPTDEVRLTRRQIHEVMLMLPKMPDSASLTETPCVVVVMVGVSK